MRYECGQKIKNICKDRGIPVKQLEIDLGFSNGYINMMAKQGTRPKEERLKAISQYLSVSPEFLLGEPAPASSDLPASHGKMINVLGRVAAGIPISAVENVIGQEEITEKLARSGDFFALRIQGDSMSPYIMDGDIVVVRQQDDAENDQIVIAIVNGDDGVCKKLKKADKSITLVSLNPAYEPMVFTMDEVETKPVRIIGVVEEIRRTVNK